MGQVVETAKPKADLAEVMLLADYWPTEEELKLNPEQIDMQPSALRSPADPGVAINTEPRFRAGTTARLPVKSAFRLVEGQKAKRLDW